MTDPRRALPSITALLGLEPVQALASAIPQRVLTTAARAVVDRVRLNEAPPPSDWAQAVVNEAHRLNRRSLVPVINGTGVILHTNLGRAPLARAALDAIHDVAQGFSNLEYDLAAGGRGSRYSHCVELLRAVTGAEDALVVNNCAAALVLALNTVSDGREAIVSRGELIEIGGSFRVPDIMAKSGAQLVEVGTTNRTHLHDYEAAVTTQSAALLKVHRSNFTTQGFTAEAGLLELGELGARLNLPLIFDFGSGLLVDLAAHGLRDEPTAANAVAAGAAIVVMSGDKLLGGPQAGILVGSRAWIERCRKNPLTRALRVDKLTIAALEATLRLYRDPNIAFREVPILKMIATPLAELQARAESLVSVLAPEAQIIPSTSTVGGGAFPGSQLPSVAVALRGAPGRLERALRQGNPPVIARIEEDQLLVDLRSTPPENDRTLADAIQHALIAAERDA